ncbi:Transcription factor spt20, partial [Ascosphaera atra]
THFRFEGQDGSFPYTSEMRFFLRHLRDGTVPHDMMEQLLNSGVRWYEDCLVVRVIDHKSVRRGKRKPAGPTAGKESIASANGADSAGNGPGNGDAAAAASSGAAAVENGVAAPGKERDRLQTVNSIHNYNQHISPSPYMPYPKQNTEPNAQARENNAQSHKPEETSSTQSQQQTSKENQGQSEGGSALSKPASPPTKPKVYTTVLHPTPHMMRAQVPGRALTVVTGKSLQQIYFL